MASTFKHSKRRQQQHSQEQVARTSSASGSSFPRKASSRRLRVTQRQRLRFEVQSRLNWLRRLFGKSAMSQPEKNPVQPTVKLNPQKEKIHRRRPNTSSVEQMSAARRRRNQVIPLVQADAPQAPQPSPNGRGEARRRPKRPIRSSDANFSPKQPPERSTTSFPTAVKPKSKPRRGFSPLIYGTRLLILGIGLGVVVGTLLSIGNPTSHEHPSATPSNQSSQIKKAVASQTLPDTSLSKLGEEIAPLKTEVTAAVLGYPQLTPGVFILDLESDAYLDLNGASTIASASTIKIPLLIAFFQDVDAGKIRADELLTMKREFIAPGSGNMQRKYPGSRYTALETATKMITISDNTATNMLIDRLGGAEALNQRFRDWGLTATAIRNKLPDVEGTNTSSAKDLATLIAKVNNGELLSKASRDRTLAIMRQTERNHLLPRGLGQGATIAHKTGYIGSMLGDAGLIELPNGKRYIAAVMVKRPRNDPRAEKLIRQISRIAYQYFSTSTSTPSTPSESVSSPDNSIISPTDPIEPLGNSPSTVAERQPQLRSRD